MQLNDAQLQTLKTAINAETDAAFVALRAEGATGAMADWLNGLSTFVVWRTNVTRAQIYHETSGEGTTWNWTTYKNQSVTEQNAWVQMFMGDIANMSLPNLRAGVSAIFTGSAAANAQRDHVLAVAKRLATRGERVFATGTGTTASPGSLGVEGRVSNDDVVRAINA